jgi:hypothetical protein
MAGFFGKISNGLKKGFGKVVGAGKTVLKKADNVVDKVENIGKKILDVPVVGNVIKNTFNELKASDPRIASLAGVAKGIGGGLEKANNKLDKIEQKANAYIDNPSSLLDRKFKDDLKTSSVQKMYKDYKNDPTRVLKPDIRNIARFPNLNMAM